MKRTYPLLAILALMVGLLPVTANAQREYDVDKFDEIHIGISGKVFVEYGDEYSVTIDASEKLLDEIEVENRGSRLEINHKRRWGFNVSFSDRVVVRITTPTLSELTLGGSANAEVGKFKNDHMYLSVSGSGDIMMRAIEADEIGARISGSGSILVGEAMGKELDAAISGSGDMQMAGKVDDVVMHISGSGGMDFAELTAVNAHVSISGSGNVRLHAEELLEGRVSGSGDVRYSGRPVVDISTPGSGSVRPLSR